MLDKQATTLLLRRMAGGDREAADEFLPLVYAELHELASRLMSGERRDHTLQPTALVHEAWLRVGSSEGLATGERTQFLSIAARAMRNVLIDHARRRQAQKRGAGGERRPLDVVLEAFAENGPDPLELDEALRRLGGLDPELVSIVEQRFFAGASNEEIASVLGVSTRTVERGWRTAQAWLRAELGKRGGSASA